MCWCYILYSAVKDHYYIGYTCDKLDSRLTRHNQKSNGFTGSTNDWTLVHSEAFSSKQEAMKREKQLKSWKSRKAIIELVGKNQGD